MNEFLHLGMYANLGGTEIFPPLEALLAQPTVYGYLRQIFILTDGGVFLFLKTF